MAPLKGSLSQTGLCVTGESGRYQTCPRQQLPGDNLDPQQPRGVRPPLPLPCAELRLSQSPGHNGSPSSSSTQRALPQPSPRFKAVPSSKEEERGLNSPPILCSLLLPGHLSILPDRGGLSSPSHLHPGHTLAPTPGPVLSPLCSRQSRTPCSPTTTASPPRQFYAHSLPHLEACFQAKLAKLALWHP